MSTQAKTPVQIAIETIDIGANTASAAAASSWLGMRGEQQQHDRAGAGQAVQGPDRERLLRAAHPPVAVVAARALAQMAVRLVGMRVAAGAEVAAHPLVDHARREQEDHHADRLLGSALEPGAAAPP